jgi:two-component system, chemotaxis family, sensor kinase Cph1
LPPTPSRERSRLEECSSEPIRTPGGIQPHGALLGFSRETRRVIVVSENALDFLRVTPAELLGRTAEDLLGDERIPAFVKAAEGANPADIEIDGRSFDAIVHRDGPITFVELEEQQAAFGERAAASATYAAGQRLSIAPTREALLAQVTQEFANLTGFDRVMVYHFHADGHGEVVAETRAEGMEPYLGLHFPASDIPVQARELYLTKVSRAIINSSATPVSLLSTAGTVDLTHAELRAVSPFHLQFMRNMGQVSTVSFSLIHRGALIGMITCANNEERRLPFLVRRNLEMLANQVALQLGASTDLETSQRRARAQELRLTLLGKIVASDDIAHALLGGDFTVTDLIAADAVAVRLSGEISRSAGAPRTAALDALAAATSLGTHTSALATDRPNLAALFPDFAGLLLVHLGEEGDFIAFFRREVVQTTDWLGDLTEQNRAETLSPRLSFSAWQQSVTGRSLPWGEAVTAASMLAADVSSALVRREESRLATLAMLDPLTGLANRRALTEHLERSTEAAIALLFLDLDGFKSINDTHGHEAGDEVLIETARRLLEHTRLEDRVVRLGGDEFVVVCQRIAPPEAEALARRIAAAASQPIGGDGYQVTASVGIVTASAGADASVLLEQADAAMYRAKQSGGNTVAF